MLIKGNLKLAIIRDYKSVCDGFYCFITVFFFADHLRSRQIDELVLFLIQSKESRYSLNSSCLALDRYKHEIEAKCVSQSKKDNKRVLSIYESKSL